MKTIYLEPDEEITSVIDQLTQVEDSEVNLVVPEGAPICRSLVNLKLLKREADNLEKNITLITTDELGQQLAPKADLIVKKRLDQTDQPSVFLESKEMPDQEKDILDVLVEELESAPEQRFDKGVKAELASTKFRERETKSMADIIGPPPRSKFQTTKILKRFLPVRSKIEQVKPRKVPETVLRSRPQPEPLKTFEAPKVVKTGFRLSQFSNKVFFIFIALALVVAGLVAYLALPKTEIIISPKTETVTFDLQVIGSKDVSQIDPVLNKIPIQLIRVEKSLSKEFPATGEKELNEKARGIITVYNEYSSSPQTLVATTRFLSTDGKLFRTTKTIIVPGAKVEEAKIVPSTIDVEVVADQPGAEYNIGPSEFTIPGFKGTAKYIGFYGRSKAPMTGGFTGKVKVVSAEDLEKAEEVVTEELKTRAQQALQEQMPTDLKLIEGALIEKITETSSSPGEEAEAEHFVFEATIVAQALLFNEADLDNLVDLNLTSLVAENKVPLSETQQIAWEKPVIDWDKEEVSLTLHIQEEVAWQIDIQALKENLAGQTEVEVRKYLASRPEIQRAKVTFWPFWVKRVPIQLSQIKIRVE
jgi:hypothetical protein